MTIPVLHIYLQHENNAPFWYEQLIYFLALVSSSACYPELYDLYDRSHMGLDWLSDHLLMSNQGDIYMHRILCYTEIHSGPHCSIHSPRSLTLPTLTPKFHHHKMGPFLTIFLFDLPPPLPPLPCLNIKFSREYK